MDLMGEPLTAEEERQYLVMRSAVRDGMIEAMGLDQVRGIALMSVPEAITAIAEATTTDELSVFEQDEGTYPEGSRGTVVSALDVRRAELV